MQWHLNPIQWVRNPVKNAYNVLDYMAGKNRNIYSWIEDWDPIKLQYNVKMRDNGVPHTYVEWCDDNCKGNWSWHFDEDYGYISFDFAIDVILFKLKEFKGI